MLIELLDEKRQINGCQGHIFPLKAQLSAQSAAGINIPVGLLSWQYRVQPGVRVELENPQGALGGTGSQSAISQGQIPAAVHFAEQGPVVVQVGSPSQSTMELQ